MKKKKLNDISRSFADYNKSTSSVVFFFSFKFIIWLKIVYVFWQSNKFELKVGEYDFLH